jgi:SLT domain-containing protein
MLERAGFTAFAEGGIVKSAQLGLVGEKGPEAIIPLDRLNSMGGGGTTINLTVNAGMGADGRNISDTIVNELIKYQRRNGKIPVVTL